MKKSFSAISIFLVLGILFSGCKNPQNEIIPSTTEQESTNIESTIYNGVALEPDMEASSEDSPVENNSTKENSKDHTNPIETTIEDTAETDLETTPKDKNNSTDEEITKPSTPEPEYVPDENEMPR